VSNRAHLTRTLYKGDDGETGWGWRMGDDYLRSYTDHLEESEVPTEALELLAKAASESANEERDLFADLLVLEKGLYINGTWHDFSDIAPVLDKALNEEHGHG